MLGFGCKITTPDENFSLSQALWQGDETKISSGTSQSHRGDESFEIVQYLMAHNDFAEVSSTNNDCLFRQRN
jgi:hypothetical protein